MKNILVILLTLTISSSHAQMYDRNGRYRGQAPAYASAEFGINGGLAFFSEETALYAKLQFTLRVAHHVQLAPIFHYVKSEFATAAPGVGIGVNFPIGKGGSYFYPGAQLGGYFTNGFVTYYGLHVGFTGRLSKMISINAEPEAQFISTATGRGVFFPVTIGLRVNF